MVEGEQGNPVLTEDVDDWEYSKSRPVRHKEAKEELFGVVWDVLLG